MRYIIAFLVSALAFFKAIVAGRYLAVSAVLILLLAPLYMQFGIGEARAEIAEIEMVGISVAVSPETNRYNPARFCNEEAGSCL